MLARIDWRIVVVFLAGIAWLGSYISCDSGGIYGNVTALTGGVAFSDGAYVVGDEVYYPVDPGVTDYAYGY